MLPVHSKLLLHNCRPLSLLSGRAVRWRSCVLCVLFFGMIYACTRQRGYMLFSIVGPCRMRSASTVKPALPPRHFPVKAPQNRCLPRGMHTASWNLSLGGKSNSFGLLWCPPSTRNCLSLSARIFLATRLPAISTENNNYGSDTYQILSRRLPMWRLPHRA